MKTLLLFLMIFGQQTLYAQTIFKCAQTLEVIEQENIVKVRFLEPSVIFGVRDIQVLRSTHEEDPFFSYGIEELVFVFQSSSCQFDSEDKVLINCHTTSFIGERNLDEFVLLKNYNGEEKKLHFDEQKGKDVQRISFNTFFVTEKYPMRPKSQGYRSFSGFNLGNYENPLITKLDNYSLSLLRNHIVQCNQKEES